MAKKTKINSKTGKPKRNGLQYSEDRGKFRDDGSTQTPEKICDCCGKKFTGKHFPVLDENNNKQKGLKQCGDCFING